MKTHRLSLSASPDIQEAVASGRGAALSITISHSETTPQRVAFYDRQDRLLAEYQVHPLRSPWIRTFRNRDPFTFQDGLKVYTGACLVTLTLLY